MGRVDAVEPGTVDCHVDYGGTAQVLRADAAHTPYEAPAIAIGSYFLFRLVIEADAVKTYVYADRDEGPQPLHQAIYARPWTHAASHGFTGRHFVYEPVRDGELSYWCERP